MAKEQEIIFRQFHKPGELPLEIIEAFNIGIVALDKEGKITYEITDPDSKAYFFLHIEIRDPIPCPPYTTPPDHYYPNQTLPRGRYDKIITDGQTWAWIGPGDPQWDGMAYGRPWTISAVPDPRQLKQQDIQQMLEFFVSEGKFISININPNTPQYQIP